MVTDAQVRLLRKKMAEGKTIASAAAAAGISERSAYTWKQGALPSEKKAPRGWRTRPDPFEGIWEKEVVPLLVADEAGVLEGTTILAELRRLHGDEYGPAQLRTLQRRVHEWRALHGPEKEVMFEQKHEAGREGSFDFTDASELGVTIAGEVFAHLFFQFVLSFSKWRWVGLAFSETFEALVHGLQNALWELGGVPSVWRSDNLSAATHQNPWRRTRAQSPIRHRAPALRREVDADRARGVASKRRRGEGPRCTQVRPRSGARHPRKPRLRPVDAYMALRRSRFAIGSSAARRHRCLPRSGAPAPAAPDSRARVHDVHGDGSAVEHYPLRASGLLGAVATDRVRGRGAAAPQRGRGLLPRPAAPRRCRGCAAIATITSTTGTSSGRSSANLGPSHATDSARSSFRRSCSGGRTTLWSTHAASAPMSSTCASCTWPRARCRPRSRPS